MIRRILFIATYLLAFAAKAQTDITPYALTPLEYQIPGTNSFDLTVYRISGGLSSFDIYWQLDNGAVQSISASAASIYWGGKNGRISNSAFAVTLPAAGIYKLKLWFKNTLPADINTANDTITQTIHVFNTLPKKIVLLEVFKHQACPPCYSAAVYTDTFITKNPDYAIASMFTIASEAIYLADAKTVNDKYSFPHPTPMMDRYKFPYHQDIGTMYSGSSLASYGKREQFYEPVQVYFNSYHYNDTTRELKVDVGADFFDNLNGDYRFNLYLTEDGVKGYQADAPDPNNFIHNHVTRAMLGGPWGLQGSLPPTISTGDSKNYQFTYTIPAAYNADNMHIIAFVQEYNTDSFSRRILNSVQAKITQHTTAITGTKVHGNEIIIFPNPVKDVLKINGIAQQSYTCSIADITGKTMLSQTFIGNTMLDVNALPSGQYIIYVDNGQVVTAQTFTKQ